MQRLPTRTGYISKLLELRFMDELSSGKIDSLKLKPRVSPGSVGDLCIGLLLVLPTQALVLVGAPYLALEALNGTARLRPIVLAVAVAFYLFRVTHLTLSSEGIRFHRILGGPKFLPWKRVRSIVPASRSEVVLKGWLWPIFPAREMSSSLSSLGHYRIEWDKGSCYFPPTQPEAFEKFFKQYLT